MLARAIEIMARTFARIRDALISKFSSNHAAKAHTPDLDQLRRGDIAANLAITLSKNERVSLRSIWAIEIFTPSLIGDLHTQIKALGWDTQGLGADRERDLNAWIRRSRESTVGGSWANLGVIARPGAKPFLGDQRNAELPSFCEYATGGVFTLTPAITCVVIQFVVREDRSTGFEGVLRTEYETNFEPIERGYRLLSPFTLKKAAIDSHRSAIRREIASWFQRFLAGIFCSALCDEELPTAELLVFHETESSYTEGEAANRGGQLMRVLGLGTPWNSWKSASVPAMSFVWPLDHSRGSDSRSAIVIEKEGIARERLKSHNNSDSASMAHFVDDLVQPLLSRWCLMPLLTAIERHLGAIRDEGMKAQESSEASVSFLDRISIRIRQGMDIHSIASDMSAYARDHGLFDHDFEEFKLTEDVASGGHVQTLAPAMRAEIARRSESLIRVDATARELLVQFGTLLSARENLDLQGRLSSLTWVLVVLTVVLTVLTVIMAWEPISKLVATW